MGATADGTQGGQVPAAHRQGDHAVGIPSIDALHRELDELLTTLQNAGPAAHAELAALQEHLQRHVVKKADEEPLEEYCGELRRNPRAEQRSCENPRGNTPEDPPVDCPPVMVGMET